MKPVSAGASGDQEFAPEAGDVVSPSSSVIMWSYSRYVRRLMTSGPALSPITVSVLVMSVWSGSLPLDPVGDPIRVPPCGSLMAPVHAERAPAARTPAITRDDRHPFRAFIDFSSMPFGSRQPLRTISSPP